MRDEPPSLEDALNDAEEAWREWIKSPVLATVQKDSEPTAKPRLWVTRATPDEPLILNGHLVEVISCDTDSEHKKGEQILCNALTTDPNNPKRAWAKEAIPLKHAEEPPRSQLERAARLLCGLAELKMAFDKAKDDLMNLHKDCEQRQDEYRRMESQLRARRELFRNRLRVLRSRRLSLRKLEADLVTYRPYLPGAEVSNVPRPEPFHALKGLGEDLIKGFGLTDRAFGVAYLLSLLTSLANRRFLLLAGHAGVGKSHLVTRSGEVLGSRKAHLIPVRPGWLDPSDLLGYFDPLAGNGTGAFRDSQLTEVLRGIGADEDLPRLILLDEMNVARVENYAADLLATLGSSDETLTLHAGRGASGLARVAHRMLDDPEKSPDNEYKDALLRILRASEGGTLPIPQASVFCGTLNVDGSTEELSPKMLDRSFLLRFPRPNLDKPSSREAPVIPFPVSVREVRRIVGQAADSSADDGWTEYYTGIKGFEECLIPLSRRVRDDYAAFLALGRELGLDADETRRAFSFARVLPRVAFSPSAVDDNARTALDTWLKGTLSTKQRDAIDEAAERLGKALNASYVSFQQECG